MELKKKIKLTQEEYYLALVATKFSVFLQQAFNTVYPNKEYLPNWHIDAIIYCLEQSIKGDMSRLIINMPPRHLKSFIASVALPAFILSQDPTAKIICISYSDELTKTLARDFRRIVESEWYRKLFTNVIALKATENEFVTTEGGFRFATSIGGTLTGRGGDFIIIDDPIKPEDTHSDTARNKVNEWFTSTLLSRLDDKKRSILILVMQRLHVNDLTGFIEDKGGFHKLSLPAIATVEEMIQVGENNHHLRLVGTPLHAERDDLQTLENIKNEVGPVIFAAQYQQRPETPDGAMFHRKWINVIDRLPNHIPGGRLIISMDTAASTSATADFTAITVVYSCKDGHFVLAAERGRWDYEKLLSKSISHAKHAKQLMGIDVTFLIEPASSGISLLGTLPKLGFKCQSTGCKHDKQTRASYALPIIHQGRLYVVNKEGENDWFESFMNELVNFPHGRFDDQVDSLVYALLWAEPKVNSRSKIYFFGGS